MTYSMYIHLYIPFPYIIWKTELTENANFLLFGANGNKKWKFIFLGRETINSNQWLLFQQICPSMAIGLKHVKSAVFASKPNK